jgi:hypothetical protein
VTAWSWQVSGSLSSAVVGMADGSAVRDTVESLWPARGRFEVRRTSRVGRTVVCTLKDTGARREYAVVVAREFTDSVSGELRFRIDSVRGYAPGGGDPLVTVFREHDSSVQLAADALAGAR